MTNPTNGKAGNKLIVNDLHLQYGDNHILKGVSFEMKAGEVVALLGASGSGKTTLLRAVAGLESPHQGSISIGASALYDAARGVDLPVEKRGLGLVFQSYALWPHKTVFDNVAYGLSLRSTPKAEMSERVHTALRNLDLAHLSERFPNQLSGGQQQRVAIARALVYNPPVILLDEPLSNLDAKLREEARAWLRELIVTMKLSALCVTHDQTEAMAMADRILLLKNGRIEQEGRPEDMYGAPQSLYTADFMGNNNRLQGKVTELRDGQALLQGEGWRCWGAARGQIKLGDEAVGLIRLERVRLAESGGDNRIAAPLITSMYLGDRWEHLFKPGNTRLRAYGPASMSAGTPAWLELPAEDLWLFPAAA